MFLLFLLLLPSILAKTISDYNCTFSDGDQNRYTDRAVGCENAEPDEVCSVLYPKSQVALNASDERPDPCFKKDGHENEMVKQTAIKTCAKTCGYCCLTQEYKCNNVEFPRYDCAKVTPAMCKEPKWRQILAEDCPNVCGMCSDKGCVDAVVGCAKDPTICRQIDMQAFVKDNCRKTCGYCGNSPGENATTCGDSSKTCDVWRIRGFCQSEFYSHGEKSRYCGNTCGLC